MLTSCYIFWMRSLFGPFSAITLHPRIMIDLKQQGVVLIVCFLILLVFSDIFASLFFHFLLLFCLLLFRSISMRTVYISRLFYSLTFLTFFLCQCSFDSLDAVLCSPFVVVVFFLLLLFTFDIYFHFVLDNGRLSHFQLCMKIVLLRRPFSK